MVSHNEEGIAPVIGLFALIIFTVVAIIVYPLTFNAKRHIKPSPPQKIVGGLEHDVGHIIEGSDDNYDLSRLK